MLQNGGGTTAADSVIVETTTQGFMKDVIEESKRQPVLVDFWATWCGPCKQLTPILEKAVKAAKGKVKLAKMDIDKHPEIPGQMGIQSIPAVIAFVNGQPADGFMGALPEVPSNRVPGTRDQRQDRRRGKGSAERSRCRARRRQRRRGRQSLWPIAERGLGNVAALAGLARCYVATGNIEQAKKTLAMVPEAKLNDPAVAAARAALEVAEQAKSVGPIDELEKKVAADPLDHQARFDLAAALNAKGKRAEAAEHLLDDRQARPQMERGRRAQAAGAVFRGLGPCRPGHG